jgi:hypothetical protein
MNRIDNIVLLIIAYIIIESYFYRYNYHLNYFFELFLGTVMLILFSVLTPNTIFTIVLMLVILYFGLSMFTSYELLSLERIILLIVTANIVEYSVEIQKLLAAFFKFFMGVLSLRDELGGPIHFGGKK